jgi:hypothetical protein
VSTLFSCTLYKPCDSVVFASAAAMMIDIHLIKCPFLCLSACLLVSSYSFVYLDVVSVDIPILGFADNFVLYTGILVLLIYGQRI